jgi:FkbM family methyltransferase
MRKMIRGLLNKIGYDIIKVNVHSDSKAGKIKKVKVGNFYIDMPGNNPQISNYKYEPDVNSQLARLSAGIAAKYPGLTVLDIGANVGDTIAVIKTAIDIPVIGIEGDDISFRFLQQNTKQFRDVTIIKQFLGDKSQTLNVELEKGGWNTTLVPTASETGHQLMLQTLDEVLEQQQLSDRNIKLLKIDTEGFDTIIIRGATGLLQNQKPVIYFEYNKTNMDAIGEDGLSTLLSLEKYGYHSLVFFDNRGRYMLTTPISQHELIRQLHFYADETNSEIAYYDICLFHDSDLDLAEAFIHTESGR